MDNNIIGSLNTSGEWLKLINAHTCSYFYIKDENLAVSISGSNTTVLRLLDISNVFKRGKMCDMFCVMGAAHKKILDIIEAFNYSSKDILKACAALHFDKYNKAEFMGVMVYRTQKKGFQRIHQFI